VNWQKICSSYGSNNRQGQLQNRTSIDERPEVVDERNRIGDGEADTIIGNAHKGSMLTMVERSSRYVVMDQMPEKTVEATHEKQVGLLKPHQDRVLTITHDNGKEFADHERTEQKLEAAIYFAHPYAPRERGSIENMNGLIRQYFSTDQTLKEVDSDKIQRVQDRLKHRPRKCLNWKTPYEAFYDP